MHKLCKRYTFALSYFCSFSLRHFPRSKLLQFNKVRRFTQVGRYFSMHLPAVIGQFEKFAPLQYAESWDNIGLLTAPSYSKEISTVLFTNDLTEVVLDEAISCNADMIYSYHPPIFSSFKSLQNTKWKDRIILKCIEKGIAIYSPHTALDAAKGGVNDWLIGCFDLASCRPITQCSDQNFQFQYQVDCNLPTHVLETIRGISGVCVSVISCAELHNFTKILVTEASLPELIKLLAKNDCISSITKCCPPPLENVGMGRLGSLQKPMKVKDAIALVKNYLHLAHVRVSFGKHHMPESEISSVAVCAGSGASVIRGTKAELYVTGEMSHHDLLDAAHQGITVILCEHSNSERGFLGTLVKQLQQQLEGVQLIISKLDKDPVNIL